MENGVFVVRGVLLWHMAQCLTKNTLNDIVWFLKTTLSIIKSIKIGQSKSRARLLLNSKPTVQAKSGEMQSRQTMTGTWSINNDELLSQYLPEDNCQHHRLPEKLGLGHTNIFKLDRDLSYIETQYSPCNDLAVLSRIDHQEPRMVVTLGLKGSSRFATHQGGAVVFKEGFTSITTFNSSEGARQYHGNKPVSQLRFSVSQSWLNRSFGEHKFASFFDNPEMQVVSHQPISSQGIIAAHALLNCNVAEKVRPLFRQGQAMAILASELSHLLIGARQASTKVNQRDRTIADQARDILFEEFQNPPSVEELAKRVGTNQFKLKQLFHHFFENTPYGLLLEFRMKKAYQLLKSSQCPIGIAAEAVGYNHASNFSAAFVKYFGFPPKEISRQD